MYIDEKEISENVTTQKEYKAGIYKVRITKAVEEAPLDKTPYVEVTFETVEDNIFSVRKRFYNSPKAISILLNLLSACGLYEGKGSVNFNAEDLIGCLLEVEFIKGEANEQGKQYLEYKAWSAKAVNKGTTTTKKTEPKKEEVIGDTEIPF